MNIGIFIIGIMVGFIAIGRYAVLKTVNEEKGLEVPKFPYKVCAAAVLIIVLSKSFMIIPTGYTGVKSTFGQISENTLQNGFNLKIPFIQSIEKVNNKQQDITFEKTDIWSETSERTAICYSGITVTYQIDKDKSAWIYANVSGYKDNLVSQSLVASAIKSSSKQLKDTDATDRSKIESAAQNNIQKSLNEKYGENTVLINKVVIENADFDDEYDTAIAAKQKAELEAEKQEIENQKAIDKAKADAIVATTQAQGQADAKKIEAEATAEANKLLEQSLTDQVLKNRMLEKWDGKMPSVISDASAMFDLGTLIKEEE